MRWCTSNSDRSSLQCSITVITPLFLGEVVRTYAWIIVLGNNGFINSVLLGIGLIAQPIQFMFTTFRRRGRARACDLPVMVVILAAGLSHIDRNYVSAPPKVSAPGRSAPF